MQTLSTTTGQARGWWALVHPKQSPTGLLNSHTDWKPFNKEEDWDSLIKWLNGHCQSTASFRHQSTKERAELVVNQIELEETVVGTPGYQAFNVYLDRHRNMISDHTQLYGPLREDSEACGGGAV